ncbi:hypothetical protein BH23ACT11_BH23ACT11_09380 [soil metagenome]
MSNPPERPYGEKLPDHRQTSPDDRRQVLKASALRPINLLTLVIGGLAGVLLSPWFFPLTVVTYLVLVFLAARDPLFKNKALGEPTSVTAAHPGLEMSPERRARWLPRGETRRKVEQSLGVYRTLVTSIKESDDVTRSVLEDAVPKLHNAADQLVESGAKREKAATVIAELKSLTNTRDNHAQTIEQLEKEIQTADAAISGTNEQLVALRGKIAQLSISDAPGERANAANINASLDELNLRLEALRSTMSSSEERMSLD